ncbi:MAG: peptidase S16 [Alphaproteobacteria bacterium]|nr:MAG: peptidase S16 [Alphaproteobacteria bacterium]
MTHRRTRAAPALPSVIPLFPLEGVLLLPRSRLPLNIFEPRYLAMVEDAMDGARIIGMIQPCGPGQVPPLYDVGCAGRISECAETGDGRYLISLTGLSRFAIVEELTVATLYRQAQVDFAAYSGDRAADRSGALDRARLIAAFRCFLDARGLDTDWDALASAADESLVNALAMLCPFGPAEKQALLEAPSLTARGDTLAALLEFAIMEDDAAAPRH